ncbi:helicase domain protein (plasmid) [Pseudarthrobacter chlorophenolicus A6]|uniref:Helicase domain protein n=1 Tax=Pseudarthrobacter chlorophenolicus (strain ATCC 700700 / DSM 12829 / CIP 107037 / JCM 12360 / KCTC 9906 / NCIMB 13794 / A6) TaxID=452863 RepID=B8HJ93_PSECP|nr:helicase-related protein [Pseudarthrobacter chlorophenolicus]ACL42491.1 helicase domain protein [Pseudarthrobacter chlorophenolicus A6]
MRSLLSEAQYDAARRTTINAHYTDAAYVQAMWSTVQELGFIGGTVLEPGSGVGTFIGFAPDTAEMTGVELDPTTAAISQALYPEATVRAESFADTKLPTGHFDLAIGNVPFANVTLHDPRHNAGGHSIHNHFILKSLELTRPGGMVAVLTSSFTLDATNPAARREMNQLADLVGAVRLPTGAHRKAAGTDAMTDLLIFRRREPGQEPATNLWETVTARQIEGTITRLNSYFDEYPERLLGELHVGNGMYGDETLQLTTDDLSAVPARLNAALAGVVAEAKASGMVMSERTAEQERQRAAYIPAASHEWEGHISATDNGFTVVENGSYVDLAVPKTQAAELRALLGLRDAARNLLSAEAENRDDTAEIDGLRENLKNAYSRYTDTYGPINRYTLRDTGRVDEETQEPIQARITPRAVTIVSRDPFGPLVKALENFDEATQTATQAALLSSRQVQPRRPVLGVDTAEEALTVTLDTVGEVDLDYAASLLGISREETRAAMGESIYQVPGADETFQTRAEYLSGNVREKLEVAQSAALSDDRFAVNVRALTEVMPQPLRMDEVEARLGAVWIDAVTHQDFVREILNDPYATVSNAAGSLWDVKANRHTLAATSNWGTQRMPASDILKQVLEQRPVRVTDEGENNRRVLNPTETAAAQEKAQLLQERFGEWAWEEPERATRLIDEYNRRFNSIVLRDYSTEGDRLTLPGMAKDWVPRPHQRAAVARMLSEPAVGLFHQVGAGKTAEMVMGVMELRRLGMVNKPAVVIPNHMLEQFAREWLQIYPQARILAASSADLAGDKRRQFVARAAANEWDAVVMTRTAFQRVSLSPEAEASYLSAEVAQARAELEAVKDTSRDGGQNNSSIIKRLEKAVMGREERLKAKLDTPADPGISFEETGIDYLVVDELHDYKNLETPSNIPGAAIQGSNRASDLHMKTEFLRQREGRRVITGATATPIANSVTEMYVMQRYLRPDLLKATGIQDFNTWAATFGQVVEEMELSVAGGDRFKLKSRFAKFQNVPELLKMFHTFADVKTAEDLKLPVPDLAPRDGDGLRQPNMLAVEPGPELREYIQDIGKRVDAIQQRLVDSEEDNMLKVSSDGRKAALDMRLVDPTLFQRGPTKISATADLLASVYEEHKDRIYTDPKTGEPDPVPGALQLVFCDFGTPSDRWNVYGELKDQLRRRGVPEHMIRFIHEAKNDTEKGRLFAAARSGQIAVLMGSTSKMGVGTNIQKRAVHLVDMDAPWRPSDVEQRHGRILRQGNQNPEVRISQVVTKESFDSFMWQGLERKSRFINQIMRGRLDVREIEDIGDNTLNFAQAKAITSGNPLVLEKAVADQDLARLSRLDRAYNRNMVAVAHTKRGEQTAADAATADLPLIQAAAARTVDTTADAFKASIDGKAVDNRGDAAEALRAWAGKHGHRLMNLYGYDELGTIATLGGHELRAKLVPARDLDHATVEVRIEGVPRATTQIARRNLLSADIGTIRQLENRVASLPRLAADVEARRQEALSRVEQADKALAEPFKHAAALKAAQANSARIDQLMADAAKPEEQAQPEPPAEIDPRLERMQRLMNASFPQQSAPVAATGTATAMTRQRPVDHRRQNDSGYGR